MQSSYQILFIQHLPFTSTCIISLVLPASLLAVHVYTPESSVIADLILILDIPSGLAETNMPSLLSSPVNELPFFIHVTVGGGIPDTTQSMISSLPSLGLGVLKVLTILGRASKQYCHYCSQITFQWWWNRSGKQGSCLTNNFMLLCYFASSCSSICKRQ